MRVVLIHSVGKPFVQSFTTNLRAPIHGVLRDGRGDRDDGRDECGLGKGFPYRSGHELPCKWARVSQSGFFQCDDGDVCELCMGHG